VTAAALSPSRDADESFRHFALLYRDDDEFLAGTVPFIREGVEAGEPALVVVNARKIDLMRTALEGHADAVQFADMADIGLNPARIIPAWRDFVDCHAGTGRRFRGIGEPIWAERSPAELVECQRHESLLNVAFAGQPAWSLLCPYDTSALDDAVIAEAHRSHPVVVQGSTQLESPHYLDIDEVAPFDGALPDPPGEPPELVFHIGPLEMVRG
jgi:hypothetical protein